MIFEIFSLITISIVSIVIIVYKWRFNYWNKRNIYTIKPAIPTGNFNGSLFGKSTPIMELFDMYSELRRKGIKYAGIFMLLRPYFLVSDLDLTKNILVRDFQNFSDHGVYVNEKLDPISGNLFNLRGVKWKALRLKLTPAFTPGSIKMMFNEIVNSTKQLSELLDDSIGERGPIEIKEVMVRYIVDIIGSVAFGVECNCLKNPDVEFRKYVDRIFGGSTRRKIAMMLSVCIPQVLEWFNISTHDKEMEEFFTNIVKETIDYREKNKVARKDFMQFLIRLKNKEITLADKSADGALIYSQDGLSLNELTAHVFLFFPANFETSSNTLTHLMYELVMNLEIQENLREEVNSVLEKYNGEMTYEAIMEMSYLDKCFQETLRKYPVATILSRKCTNTYKIPGLDVVFNEGDDIFISVYGIHHDPEYYPDPEKFDPERFSEEEKSKRDPLTFLPFGEGPRICIGLRFAAVQIKAAVVTLLRKYRFTLNDKTETPLQHQGPRFIYAITNNVWLNAERI